MASADPAAQRERRYRVAAALCFFAAALAFRHAVTIVIAGAAAWIVYRTIIRRDARVLVCVIVSALCLAAFEWIGGKYLERQIAERFQPGIDHRLKPDPAHGINRDGIRCPVEASDFTADT